MNGGFKTGELRVVLAGRYVTFMICAERTVDKTVEVVPRISLQVVQVVTKSAMASPECNQVVGV